MKLRKLEILDTTLRDGSYVIDFQFTARDTALIASVLEAAGIALIEVGHGLGLGASREGRGEQAASDESYLEAAASVLDRAFFGAFFIPGIGTEDDLRMAADKGAHFIRVGVNVTELTEAEPFVGLAKKLGLTVFCNPMKSYAVDPAEFGNVARMAEAYGADVLCLVDSAGGMLPEDVRRYLESAKESCGLRLGFHGHNNLSLAVANTLEAHRAGASVLDGSLQGLGRSEGNAMTEILAAVLQKGGHLADVDVNILLDAGEAFARPLLRSGGYTGLGVTSGRAKFHSAYLGNVTAVARLHGIDARDLILSLGEHDTVDPPLDLVERIAKELAREGPKSPFRFAIAGEAAKEPSGFPAQVRERARELKEKAKKLNLDSVLNVVVSGYETTHVSPFVETGFGCAISNVMLADPSLLKDVLVESGDLVDYLLVDSAGSAIPTKVLGNAVILEYVDHDMWARAAVAHVLRLSSTERGLRRIAVIGVRTLVVRTASLFADSGAEVWIDEAYRADAKAPSRRGEAISSEALETFLPRASVLVALSPRNPCVDAQDVESMAKGALLFDGGIGSLAPESVVAAEGKGLRVVRIDMRATLAATALEAIRLRKVVEDHMGRDTWDGVPVVAGGLIGNEGEVVVDSIRNAGRVIGIADGKGGIRAPGHKDENVRKVQKTIADRQLRRQ